MRVHSKKEFIAVLDRAISAAIVADRIFAGRDHYEPITIVWEECSYSLAPYVDTLERLQRRLGANPAGRPCPRVKYASDTRPRKILHVKKTEAQLLKYLEKREQTS